MTLRRFLLVSVSVLVALTLGVLLYLAFGDLGRHKPFIENFVTERTGRPFEIHGPLKIKLLPAVSISAEDVRLANADWGTEQPMLGVGRFSTVVDLWSLISGPVEIRTLELSDVVVLLEKNADGTPNWVLHEQGEAEVEAEPDDTGVAEVPAVIENGTLTNVRVTYREPGKDDRVAVLNTLTIAPGTEELLAVSADGGLDEYAATLKGELGPIDSLISGRNIRMTVDASVGNMSMELSGSVGRLDPLDGADLRLNLANPDVGTMLKNLQLPQVAAGAMKAEATLKDQDDRTGVDVEASLGDIHASIQGSLAQLGLTGSDLNFDATVGDAGRLAEVFGLTGVPSEELRVGGRMKVSQGQVDLEGVNAALGGAKVRADGSIRRTSRDGSTLKFEAEVDNLAGLREGLPATPAKLAGTYVANRGGFEIKDARLLLRKNELTGAASVRLGDRRRVDATLSSARIELPPRKKQEPSGQQAGSASAQAAGKGGKSKGKFVFPDTPLPLEKLQGLDAHVQANFAQVTMDTGTLRDVATVLDLDHGRLSIDFQAKGAAAGRIASRVQLVPSKSGADLTLTATVRDLRTGLQAASPEDRDKTPPTNIDADIRASGKSPRQMAATANGSILLTQGKGRVKKSLVSAFGSDILNQLGSQLNPFSTQDPYTKIQCSVAKAKIVNGQATVDPVLMQSDKVTVVSKGTIDLRTEKIAFDFNTRPRKGIGVSPGMFTNPFIQLAGTLANPHIATGAKGVVSGALAVGTGGISVVAKGLLDRIAGEVDVCEKTLAEVSRGSAPTNAPSETSSAAPDKRK